MKYIKKIILGVFLFCVNLVAQNTKTYKIYFEVNNAVPTIIEKQKLVGFVGKYKTKIKHISFIGYCDDNASKDYNLILSKKRAVYIKEFIWKHLDRQLPFLLDFQGELDLTKTKNTENQRKQNRRVDVICTLFGEKKTKRKNNRVKKKISNPKGMSYHDFLSYRTDLEPGVVEERNRRLTEQKVTDSIARIVTQKEIEDFEKGFLKTKIGKELPFELFYNFSHNKVNHEKPFLSLKLKAKKKIYLLSLLMHKYPKLKIKIYSYKHERMPFKKVRNISAKRTFMHECKLKNNLAMNYLVKEGIEKKRIVTEIELVKKYNFKGSNTDKSRPAADIIRLN